ncbi:MAG: hypothetical protein EOP53_03420 [Sphingobacteriales bacterium]|nr:MAG: hypothetical protein EOP53_03420 [Sphingobacteriales bacterium]
MPYFFYYLLKIILCSAVLFGYYHLFLRNKVYHAYNRFYLLAATVISLLAPLLNFNMLFADSSAHSRPIQLLQAVNSSDAYLEEIIIYSHKNYLSTSQLLLLLYSIVSLVMLILLVKVFIQIFRILKTNGSRTLNDVVFVQSDAKGTPFSFFRFIFWNKAIDINTPTGRQIFAHELAHVREKHSADKLYLNLLLIVFWINPIFWFIKKELNLIHEFIADRKAVADNDAGALAAMIVQSAYPQHAFLLTSHFFYSPIKRRLKMLTKYNNKKAGYLYRILALPVVLFLVAALTIKAKSGINEILNPVEKIKVVIDAGHGGTDGGALAPDGKTREKELTLQLVKKIKELNDLSNIELVFTRESDVYQHPTEKLNFTKKAAADLFISVHISNGPAAANNTKSGAEVFISRDEFSNSRNSRLFASSVIENFKANYGLEVTPNPIQRKLGIAVLQADYPAILIEAGYLNNTKDLAYLQSEIGQTAFAKNVLAAIASFASNRNNASIQDFKSIAQDTIPSETYGTYKGEKVTGVSVKVNATTDKKVTLTLAGGKKVNLSMDQALKEGIELPPPPAPGEVPAFPPPPPAAPPAPPAPPTPDDKRIDASQRAVVDNGQPKPAQKEVIFRGMAINNPATRPLFVLDGNIMQFQGLESIDPNTIEAITILKGDKAASKYGAEKTMNGVVEIYSKGNPDYKKPPATKIKMDDEVVLVGLKKDNLISLSQSVKGSGSNIVFTQVEVEAEFPGGKEAWRRYLMKNLDAGIAVDEGWSEGTHSLILSFIVNADGSISGIKTENYSGTKTAQACIDLIRKGPKWKPALQNGKPVNAIRKQPITFVIQEQKEETKPPTSK